jgi:hypothetical protein
MTSAYSSRRDQGSTRSMLKQGSRFPEHA